MPDPVTHRELIDLALRAYDAEQEAIAGCLYMIIHASEQSRLDDLFAGMASFNRETLEDKAARESRKPIDYLRLAV